LDAYSGKVLFYSSWKDQTLFGKATAIGIPFHRGEFGIWNQFLLFIFGAGVIFSLISGWTMFFNRFKGDSFFIPPVHIGSWRGIPISIWLLALALLCLIPLLVIGFAFIIFAEAILFFFGNKIFFYKGTIKFEYIFGNSGTSCKDLNE
jgi:uncharacterized iron-regulated membrane protein